MQTSDGWLKDEQGNVQVFNVYTRKGRKIVRMRSTKSFFNWPVNVAFPDTRKAAPVMVAALLLLTTACCTLVVQKTSITGSQQVSVCNDTRQDSNSLHPNTKLGINADWQDIHDSDSSIVIED